MASMWELLKATTKKQLQMLSTAWTTRYTEGRWTIQLGYSPEGVTRTEDGYEAYMNATRKADRGISMEGSVPQRTGLKNEGPWARRMELEKAVLVHLAEHGSA